MLVDGASELLRPVDGTAPVSSRPFRKLSDQIVSSGGTRTNRSSLGDEMPQEGTLCPLLFAILEPVAG